MSLNEERLLLSGDRGISEFSQARVFRDSHASLVSPRRSSCFRKKNGIHSETKHALFRESQEGRRGKGDEIDTGRAEGSKKSRKISKLTSSRENAFADIDILFSLAVDTFSEYFDSERGREKGQRKHKGQLEYDSPLPLSQTLNAPMRSSGEKSIVESIIIAYFTAVKSFRFKNSTQNSMFNMRVQ